MKERPILFSAPMVRAILNGAKSQTRRVVKPQPVQPAADRHPHHAAKHPAPYLDAYCSQRKTPANPRGMSDQWCWWQVDDRQCLPTFRCPYGQPGDRLWVRETCTAEELDSGLDGVRYAADGAFREIENSEAASEAWAKLHAYRGKRGATVPPIHMPRWASRILLEVTGVRVERLKEISRGDAMDEGCPFPNMADGPDPRRWCAELWEQINGPGSWESNPWVWAVWFRSLQP